MICSFEVICKLVSSGKIHWFPICRFSWNMKLSTAHHPVTNQLLKNGRIQVSFNRLDFTWLTFVFLEPWWVTSVKDICWWLQYYFLRWRLKTPCSSSYSTMIVKLADVPFLTHVVHINLLIKLLQSFSKVLWNFQDIFSVIICIWSKSKYTSSLVSKHFCKHP